MPSSILPAQPSFVMPMTLCRLFEEVHYLDAMSNEYADGRSTRRALAFNDRHTFRLVRPLTDSQLDDLRGFYLANDRLIARGHPFWFYNTRETSPLFSWDASGSDPVGRYTVVWEGGWHETLQPGRHESSFVLREVQ